MADPVLNDLQLKYQPLVTMGMTSTFQATYRGVFTMPQTERERDILSIGQGNPFAATLREISNAVLQTYGERVWKGITRREDNLGNTEYWLWVEPDLSGVIAEQSTHYFRVEQCTPFPGNGIRFSHGVSIKVSVIPPSPTLPR